MCYNCGCFNPQDKMGHEDNITDSTFQKLSEKWGKTLEEIKQIVLEAIEKNKAIDNPDLVEMFEKASKAWGQSKQEAEENTKELLKQELGK